MVSARIHPNAGKRLLPVVVDEVARDDPERACLSIPKSTSLADGFEDITFWRLANAINRMSWFIETHIGRSESFETFAYIGRSDIRYIIVALAAAKTGWKALFSSHMNSLAGHLNLLRLCSCNILMTATGVDVRDILNESTMRNITIPSLDELIDPTPVPQYPYREAWEEARRDPYLILHTSGTTGLPKPITFNHSVPAAMDAHSLVDTLPSDHPGYNRMHRAGYFKGRILVSFPPFHVIVCNFMFALAVYAETVLVFPSRDGMGSAKTILESIDYLSPDSAFLPPSILSELAKSDDGLSRLARMKFVFYGGGILPQQAGQLISAQNHLINIWGSTENGGLVLGEREPSEWEYLTFDPDYNGLEWRVVSQQLEEAHDASAKTEELYEPVIVKNPALEPYQTTFLLYPELDEWSIGDLYTKHPSKPHTWKFAGRTDDLICFAHSVKYHPLNAEGRIAGHSDVQAAVMFGDEHLQAVLLVELREEAARVYFIGSGTDCKGVEDSVWELVEEVNRDAPTVAYIARTHVVFANPSKPFPRAGKGTVQRTLTTELYRDEIEACYRTFGDTSRPMLGRIGR